MNCVSLPPLSPSYIATSVSLLQPSVTPTIPGVYNFPSVFPQFDGGHYNRSEDSSSTTPWIVPCIGSNIYFPCHRGPTRLFFTRPSHLQNQKFVPSTKRNLPNQPTAISKNWLRTLELATHPVSYTRICTRVHAIARNGAQDCMCS